MLLLKTFGPSFLNGDQDSKTHIKLEKILKTGKMFSKLRGVLFFLKGFTLSYTILFFHRNSKVCRCRISEWNEGMSSQDKMLGVDGSSSDKETDRCTQGVAGFQVTCCHLGVGFDTTLLTAAPINSPWGFYSWTKLWHFRSAQFTKQTCVRV